jgi:hypothetical protein
VLIGLLRFKPGRGSVLKPEFRLASTRSRLQLAQRGEERGMKAGQPLFPWRKWFSTGSRGNRIFLRCRGITGLSDRFPRFPPARGVCSFFASRGGMPGLRPLPEKSTRGVCAVGAVPRLFAPRR